MNADVIKLILQKATTLQEARDFMQHISGAPVAPPADPAPVVAPSTPEPLHKRKRSPGALAKLGGCRWPADQLAIVGQCKTESDIAAAAELFGRTQEAVKRQLVKIRHAEAFP